MLRYTRATSNVRVESGARYDYMRSRADSTETSWTPPLDVIDERWAYATIRQSWAMNWMRLVENQLDWTHLPFVHSTTIGVGFPRGLTVRAAGHAILAQSLFEFVTEREPKRPQD